ncbi:hypothetical protein ACU639_17830 [Streptomyces cynarae]|uniref:hypothetical protein n=1 Tax=Streptomyces cynarae TaxID=2981134 RepID=UPI00406D1AEF
MSKSNRITRDGAISSLKRIFGDTTTDYISVEEMYVNAGRTGMSEEKNKQWRYNVLSNIRPYGLFKEKYGVKNHVRVIEGIRLTEEGKRALRAEPQSAPKPIVSVADREVSFSSVRADIKVLREKYPEFAITFDARLKEEDDE